MSKEVLEKLQELITMYQKHDAVEGLFLTTYIRNNVKVLELSVLVNALESSIALEEIACNDNFKIVQTLLTKKDLTFKEENEITLLKLLNSTILLEENKKLSDLKKELIKAADNISLARMNNEMNFYEIPEIISGIKI